MYSINWRPADAIRSRLAGRLLTAAPMPSLTEVGIGVMIDNVAETIADALIERYGERATRQIIEVLFPVD